MKQQQTHKTALRSRWYKKLDRIVNRGLTALRAIHQGFWLGMMDKQHYNEIIGLGYTEWKQYHADDYNKSGLWPWEDAVIRKYFSACKTILIGAAGGGREIISLVREGYQADGFDCFPEFLESSKHILASQGMPSRLELALPDHVPDVFEIYDGGIMGWSGYSHISGTENRVLFLKEFHQHIKPGGPLLLSFFTLPENSLQFKIIFSVARLIRSLRLSKEKVEPGDILIDMYFHYASQSEVQRELELAGFTLVMYEKQHFGHAIGIAR